MTTRQEAIKIAMEMAGVPKKEVPKNDSSQYYITKQEFDALKNQFKAVDIERILKELIATCKFQGEYKDFFIWKIKTNVRVHNTKAIIKDEKITEIPEESLQILKNPELFNNIIKELSSQIEGEEKSKKAIFLSLCSIWVDGVEVPLNTLVSSESSAGKSYVCKKIIKIFPEHLVQARTKITPEAFTYWHNQEDSWTWDGKICYLEDISQSILDAPTFKVMCSEGSIATIVVKQKAYDLEIKGKPCMLVTTARTSPNTEILGRFQIVSLNLFWFCLFV